MTSVSNPLLSHARSLRAFLAASLRKLLKMERHDGDFATQRMCPSCGRITPRFNPSCLECGESLKPA